MVRHPFRAVALGAGLGLLAAAASIGSAIWRHGGQEKILGWEWDHCPSPPGLCVAAVDPDGPAAGRLAAGDRLLSLGGRTDLAEALLLRIPPGEPYSLALERAGERLEVALEAEVRQRPGGRRRMLTFLFGSVVFCALGLALGLVRPDHRVAQLAAGFSLAQAAIMLGTRSQPLLGFLSDGQTLLLVVLMAGYPANMLLAYSTGRRFPAGLLDEAPRFRFERLLYAAGAALYLAVAWRQWVFFRGVPDSLPAGYDHRLFEAALQPTYVGLFIVLGIAACGAVARNYRRLESPGERRRIRWVVYGAAVAIAPQVAVLLLRPALEPETFSLWYDVSRLATVALPLTAGFAILKHRLFDIRVVVRRGVQYLLARNSLRVLLLLPAVGIVYTVLSHPERPVGELVLGSPGFLGLLAAAVLGLVFRTPLAEAIDRRFFRSVADRERLLTDLIADLHELPSLQVVCDRVAEALRGALHPRGIRVLLREGPALRLMHSSLAAPSPSIPGSREALAQAAPAPAPPGFDSDETLARPASPAPGLDSQETLPRTEDGMPDHFELPRLARADGAARTPRELAAAELPPAELRWLADREVELVVPVLSGEGELSGFFLLGEKASEEAYTVEDRRLLEALARETGVRQETLALRRRVELGRRERTEVLARLGGEAEAVLRECPACGRCFDGDVERCPDDGAELVLTLPVERAVVERYRLDRLLGKGGMGAVYQGTDLRLGREVAIKLLLGGRLGNPEALARFNREARAAARLGHPNILTVFDYGTLPHGGAYLVSELLVGKTLRQALVETGPIPPERAAGWLDQLLAGLEAAHEAGVVHRDLKPENALLARTERPEPVLKILDFGLAKLTLPDAAEATSLSLPGTVMGTLRYMSPEQIAGAAVDERTDVYSVAVVTIELLTGRHPLEGLEGPKLVGAVLGSEIRFPGESAGARALDAVLQRALVKDPARRTRSVRELRGRLAEAVRGLEGDRPRSHSW